METAVHGKLLTPTKIADLEGLMSQESVGTLLVPERILRAGQTLLKARGRSLLKSNQLEVPLHLERKVQNSAISYERADVRMETHATFGTHLFAEMKPLLKAVL